MASCRRSIRRGYPCFFIRYLLFRPPNYGDELVFEPDDDDESDHGEIPDSPEKSDESATGPSDNPPCVVIHYLKEKCALIKDALAADYERNPSRSPDVIHFREQFMAGTFWIHPKDPSSAYIRRIIGSNLKSLDDLEPVEFYHPSIFVFSPMDAFPTLTLTCPAGCCKQDKVGNDKKEEPILLSLKGWAPCRRVIAHDRVYYVRSRLYRCNKCRKVFNAHCDQLMNSYPYEVKESFPAVFSHRSGLDKRVVDMMPPLIASAVTTESLTAAIAESHSKRYWRLHLAYMACCKSILEFFKKSAKSDAPIKNSYRSKLLSAYSLRFGVTDKDVLAKTNALCLKLGVLFPDFSSFKDLNGYRGHIPSGVFLYHFVTSHSLSQIHTRDVPS